MAEEAKKKSDAPAAPPHGERSSEKKEQPKNAGGASGLLAKTPVLLGGAMIVEAAILFAGFKFLGSGAPRHASGAELSVEESSVSPVSSGASESSHGGAAGTAAKSDGKKSAEVQVIDFRAPNKQSGRTFLYDVTIYAVTRAEYKDRVESTLKEHEALIKDRVRTIIAQSDPEKLGGGSEPGLETLRRQVKYQLDEIVGEGMIDEVLVPRCIPFRTDY